MVLITQWKMQNSYEQVCKYALILTPENIIIAYQ